jgi:hypothetical protein
MALIKWNGGLELDPKSIISILAFTFACGGLWVKLDNLEKRFDYHERITEARIMEHDKMVVTVSDLVSRVDDCCPYRGRQRRR